jgi:hypothetical protein
MKECSIEGCRGKYEARGLCAKHYRRLCVHGSPLANLNKSRLYRTIRDRTMPITETGCLIWTGRISSHGYGTIKVDGKNVGAHRIAWELEEGTIPKDMLVLHKCDVRTCVNVNHLFLGNHADNMKDARIKDRYGRKISNADVFQIKDLYGYGFTQREIGGMWGVTAAAIQTTLKKRLPALRAVRKERG